MPKITPTIEMEQGWYTVYAKVPKKYLPHELKALFETTLYWGRLPQKEDAEFYWFLLWRSKDKSEAETSGKNRLEFFTLQLNRATETLRRWAK